MDMPMMKCGHTANGHTQLKDGTRKPCCVICAGLTPDADIIDDAPDLTGRRAKCSSCSNETDSSLGLPFFEHRPTGERDGFYCGCYGWD